MSRRRAVELGLATHPGQVRELNEDTLSSPAEAGISGKLRSAKGVLLAVADGMGGHAAGEVASQLAIATLYARYYYDPSPDLASSLRQAVELANTEVHGRACSGQATHGMGTTLVAAVIRGNHLIVANVGDSRAYVLRKGQIRQISRDHSWVAESMAAGLLTPEQARTHRYRNLVTRALGQKPEVEVDVFQERLNPGDVVILCSDGLTGEVRDADIAKAVGGYPVSEAAAELVAMANRCGGRDNISVVVAGVPGRPAWLSGPVLAAAAMGLAICAVALYLLAFAQPRPSWLQAKRVATTMPVEVTASDMPTVTVSTVESTSQPTAAISVTGSPQMNTPIAGGVVATASVTAELVAPAATPVRADSTALPATTTPLTDTGSLEWRMLGPVVHVPLRWGCHNVERCESGEDALAGLLASFGYRVGELEVKLQGFAGGLVLELDQRIDVNLAKAPVECLLGIASGLTVHTQKEGQFFSGELRLETGDAREIVVTMTRSGLGVPCRSELASGEELVVCGYPARPAQDEHRLLGSFVVLWSEAGQPEVWLPQDEFEQWVSGEGSVLKRIGLPLPGVPVEGLSGDPGTDLVLAYARRDETAGRCQLSVHPVEFEEGIPALFFWDTAHARYVYSEE